MGIQRCPASLSLIFTEDLLRAGTQSEAIQDEGIDICRNDSRKYPRFLMTSGCVRGDTTAGLRY